MSINIENLFVKCDNQAKVADLVDDYLQNPTLPTQPDWGLPSSFALLLANEPKRKIAVSPPLDGWIALIESKDVVDFALANALSEKMETCVLVIQLSEASGAAGCASVVRGKMLESQFNEEDADPLATVRGALKKHKIPFDTTLFREAVQRVSEGWIVKQKR